MLFLLLEVLRFPVTVLLVLLAPFQQAQQLLRLIINLCFRLLAAQLGCDVTAEVAVA